MTTRRIAHGDLTLALHELRRGADGSAAEDAPPRLLLVHDLEGSARAWTEPPARGRVWSTWPGAVLALDLAGHGASDWRPGGAYTPELFAADIDATLAAVGPCVIAGAGIGAYAALLVAGARPELAPAVLLLPGRGLSGGGPAPELARVPAFLESIGDVTSERASDGAATDPLVRTCASDFRPIDYARAFAARARRILLAEDGLERPPWWESIRAEPTIEQVRGNFADTLGVLTRGHAPASLGG